VAVFRKPRAEEGEPRPKARRKRSIDFDSADAAVLATEIEAWVGHNRPKLGEVMLELGSIDPDQLIRALQHQKENPTAEGAAQLGQVLLELGSIDETALAAALAAQFGIPLADLRHEKPDPEVTEFVGEELARKHTVIPLRKENDRIFMAIADPLDTTAIEELTRHCKRIGLMMGTRSEIERLLDESYNVLQQAQAHIQAFELTEEDGAAAREDDGFSVDDNAPIVQVVNRIITQGVRSRASDIHIEPGERFVRVRYRIDGAMTEAIQLPTRMSSALASRVKVMANLNIVERRRPQDGQFGVTIDGRPIDIRTATAATVHGEKIVMRLLDKTKSLIGLQDLGMHPAVQAPYMKIVKAPLGMLLCTGPTGSGKTTTLYATLTEINDPRRNVVTIEDPVEYQFDGISQMPVSDTGMSFADGLRGILRQDPDVILVGEIRDEETARIAMQASLTGHFVLSSLHAVDSVAAVHRFTDMGIEPFLVASALSGVVGQRLLRRICTSCAAPYTPTPAEIRIIAEQVGHQPEQWLKGRGCNMCNETGYRGRIGVYELLQVTDAIRELIVARATHHELRALAVEEGMRTMQAQAFELVVDGKTTVEEVIRGVYAPGVDRDDVEDPKELPAGTRELSRGPGLLDHGGDGPEAATRPEGDRSPITMGPAGGRTDGPAAAAPAGGAQVGRGPANGGRFGADPPAGGDGGRRSDTADAGART
jgi:type IV pilus assembly protein PilB